MAKRPVAPTSSPTDNSAAIAATSSRRRAAPADKPKQRHSVETKKWERRLTSADKQFKLWSDKFECDRLDRYYDGEQWRGLSEDQAKRKYVLNLVFATVETQLPSLLFSQPKVMVEPRPQHGETANSNAGGRSTLIQDAIQTVIEDPKVHFNFETTLGLRDAYSRYGLVEVGFSADYIDNPNAGKPVLNEKDEALGGEDDDAPKQPAKIRQKETIYVKRLDPAQFRAYPGNNLLTANDWCAYYEWVYLEDIKRNKNYQNTDDLQATGVTTDADTEDPDYEKHAGMVKLWKIWDLRLKVRHVHADGHKRLLQTKAFTHLPVEDMKFYERRNSYYPVPPIYNWLSPQDEINESREQQRVHRRRANRYFMREAAVSQTEFDKLTGADAEDMTCIEVPRVNPPPIVPIESAQLGNENWTELAASRDDLNQITGVSGEARNSPEAPTATQANIVNVRAQLRESRARTQVADWLGRIARKILLVIREQAELPLLVKQSVDPFSAPTDIETVARGVKGWLEVKKEDIDDLDVDVKIDVTSLSPVAEENDRNAWNTVLTLLTNPALGMLLMTPNPAAPNEPSPLLRKTLTLNGVKSDQEIREIWRVGQSLLKQAADAAAASAAHDKIPEPMKLSLALKAEDFKDPILGPLLLMILTREENLQNQAAMNAQPPTLFSQGGNDAPPPPSEAPGPITGTPVTTGA